MGRILPGVKMWPVESDDIRYGGAEKNYTLNLSQKQSVAGSGFLPQRTITSQTGCKAPSFASGKLFLWRWAKLAHARLARADFTQMFEAVDSGCMAVGKFNLNCVVPYRRGALGGHAGLKHR
jgi:hypothetical protein